MTQPYPSLLVTKLAIPRVRPAHVSRDSLLSLLDSGIARKLVVVAAAAGFGKTTLAAEWSRRHVAHVAWLSLDGGDNDPARFLSYVLAAVQTRQPLFGVELLTALQSPQPPPLDSAVYSLVNALAALDSRLILVLDDYHSIENGAIHNALAFLIDHLATDVTLVLLTREDPPLPLGRLRASGDLLEIRASALRFSADDAARFLNETMVLDLTPDAVRALEARTEGWIAGLQLAALALQPITGGRERFVREFSGSHRFILDYLIEEVLSQQDEHTRRFLLQTSLLRRFNAALCAAVTGAADAQAILDDLERRNLFLIPLDDERGWYRYHHLFAELLRARFNAESSDLLTELYRRAGQWYAANGYPEDAVSYTIGAGDYDHAADLILGAASGVSQRGEVETLLNWYIGFHQDFVRQHPRLALYFGMAFALNGRWQEAKTLLGYVEGLNEAARPEESLMLAYLVAGYRQDAAHLERIAAQANTRTNPLAMLVLALVRGSQGIYADACRLMEDAQESAERSGDATLALTALFHRCRFHVFLGTLHAARDLSARALDIVQSLGGAALPYATMTHTALCRVYLEWNELDRAADHARQAIAIAERTGFLTGVVSSSNIMLAEVAQAQGAFDAANRLADEAFAAARRHDPPPEIAWLRAYRARLWLAQGNTPAAAEWLHESLRETLPPSLFYPPSILPVTQARVLLAQRKTGDAIALLTRLLSQPHDLLSVEAFGVLALARQAQGDSVHAMLALQQAVALAAPERRVRAFLDLGAPMAALLARYVESLPEQVFVRAALSAFPAPPRPASTVEPLGERELDVLRLIVAGQSNDEIARTLSLAISTVKWYINVIYGKLHVKTRAQAIARTHALHLLD